MKKWIIILVVTTAFGGCSIQYSDRSGPVYPTEDIHLTHPHLIEFRNRYDRALAYYYMGDLERCIGSCERLIRESVELRQIDPPSEICSYLDSLETLTMDLRQKSCNEKDRIGWESHISAVLDSIARHHVVEEEIEIAQNWRTKYWLDYFQGKGRRYFQRWLGRVQVYRDIIEPILIENELTRDLLYLAVIESGINPRAESHAHAVGAWQFLAGTGRVFNLRINWWIDDRRDIIASTYAAAHYLQHLHSLFGNWELALAAYNCGEYRVAYAINRQGTRNYWRLRLPSQTRWFVPKFMAALEIGRNPSKYGFGIPDLEPLDFDIIEVTESVDLRVIARAASTTYTRIKKLNPALKRWATPPNMVVEVKVPAGKGKDVLKVLSELDTEDRVSWHRHIIQRDESISTIAAKYGIAQSELVKMNGIENPRRIRAGKTLIVPVRDSKAGGIRIDPLYKEKPKLPGSIRIKKPKPPENHSRILYTVNPGDNLGEIASRFKVRLKDLRSWNDMKYSSMIKAGSKLVIYLPPGFVAPSQSGGKIRMIYVVKEGDTLNSISSRYDTPVEDILKWNNGIKGDRLYPGNKITILVDPNQSGSGSGTK